MLLRTLHTSLLSCALLPGHMGIPLLMPCQWPVWWACDSLFRNKSQGSENFHTIQMMRKGTFEMQRCLSYARSLPASPKPDGRGTPTSLRRKVSWGKQLTQPCRPSPAFAAIFPPLPFSAGKAAPVLLVFVRRRRYAPSSSRSFSGGYRHASSSARCRRPFLY